MTPNFEKERIQMVKKLQREEYLKSKEIIQAMKQVPREKFMPTRFKQHAYNLYRAFPIPPFTGKQTISAPNTYPLFYEPLKLQKNDNCLEVGTGSGYGAALLQEIIGRKGNVVTIEYNKKTYEFARKNLKDATYNEVTVLHRDGSKGYPPKAPYEKIIVAASFIEIPQPLKNQLSKPGQLIMPVGSTHLQTLTLLKKDNVGKFTQQTLDRVLYVPLKGEYGYKGRSKPSE